MRQFLSLVYFLHGLLVPGLQQSLSITDVQVRHDFGQWIEFQAQVDPDLNFSQMNLIVSTPQGDVVLDTDINGQNHLLTVYDFADQDWIRPFLTLAYRYRATTISNQVLESAPQTFTYTDNRYNWQSLTSDTNVAIYWYEGDLQFGQEIATAAELGRNRFRELTTLPTDQPVQLYIYDSYPELQTALGFESPLQIAGHASRSDGIAWAAITPGAGQTQLINQTIPHELAHILLNQSLGDATTRLPAWLNEGVASITELYPNPDFVEYLNRANSSDSLYSISALCQPFPPEQAAITLAYAQSESFTRYLVEEYGPAGLAAIIQSYAYGASCEEGPQPITGRTLPQLESDWRRERFGTSGFSFSLGEIQGWYIIGLLVALGPLMAILERMRRVRK